MPDTAERIRESLISWRVYARARGIIKTKIAAQVILQNYMFEQLLVRLSASTYKEKFVLKGGMLVAAIA